MSGTVSIFEGRACAALLASLHGVSFPPPERWDEAAFAPLLDMPGCFACLHHGSDPSPDGMAPDGMALLRVAADEAELLTIAVLPAARGQGVGAALLARAKAECAQRGAARIFLEVDPGNKPACALYRRHGFAEIGRRKGYYADGSDALVMQADLDQPPSF